MLKFSFYTENKTEGVYTPLFSTIFKIMKYIFDVDGTLTLSRQVIDSSFEAFMIVFCCKHDVYLVTGSDRQKTVDQLGLDICYRAKRVYN